MEWTDVHDDLLIREILSVEPYQYKASTVKRGNAWTQVADILNAIPEPAFRVNQRSVRERYSLLEKAFLKKEREEKKASGINPPELTNNEKGIEEIVEKTKEAAVQELNDENCKSQQERKEAIEIRQKSVETFSETRKRNSEEDDTPRKRGRSSGSETIAYLRQKSEVDADLKKEELRLKALEEQRIRENAEQQQKMLTDVLTQQRHQMQSFMQQQQVMQQRQQQFATARLQAQQQQAQLFMAMIEKLKKD